VTEAQRIMDSLKIEQARGNYDTARYYEKKRKWLGAKIYYNAVINTLRDNPDHPYAEMALRRIDAINKRLVDTQ
jgi:outer membrane protein assembly factor BamD (BamD/ComL family)